MFIHLVRLFSLSTTLQIGSLGLPYGQGDGAVWQPMAMVKVGTNLIVADRPATTAPLAIRLQAFDLTTGQWQWSRSTPVTGQSWYYSGGIQTADGWYLALDDNGSHPLVTDGTSLFYITRVVLSNGQRQFTLCKFALDGTLTASRVLTTGANADQRGLAYHQPTGLLYLAYADNRSSGPYYDNAVDPATLANTGSLYSSPFGAFATLGLVGNYSDGTYLWRTRSNGTTITETTRTVPQGGAGYQYYTGRPYQVIGANGTHWLALDTQNYVTGTLYRLRRYHQTGGSLTNTFGQGSGTVRDHTTGIQTYASCPIDADTVAILDQTVMPATLSELTDRFGTVYQAYEVLDYWSSNCPVVYVRRQLTDGTWATPVSLGTRLTAPQLTLTSDGRLRCTVIKPASLNISGWRPHNVYDRTNARWVFESTDGGVTFTRTE
jgi:hypothetical protein